MSHIWMNHVNIYECAMSNISMSHVTHINESCHTYQWVVSHIWTSHITHSHGSCHTKSRLMSHMKSRDSRDRSCGPQKREISNVARNEPSEWVVSHICMSHVPHMNESCHLYEWVMSHIRTSHATYMCVKKGSYHMHEEAKSHICESHKCESHMCESHICESHICESHICDSNICDLAMTHIYDSHICDMKHS